MDKKEFLKMIEKSLAEYKNDRLQRDEIVEILQDILDKITVD